MTQETPKVNPEEEALPSPLRCLYGAIVAGAMSFAAYLLTSNVIVNFASHPPTGNGFAVRIGITVRTLIMGLSTMATAIFGMIAVGLLLLGIQSFLASKKTATSED